MKVTKKVVIRSHKKKDRQYNGQKKGKNNDPESTTQKINNMNPAKSRSKHACSTFYY